MVNKMLKKKSKRITLRKKHMILKKVRSHKKKLGKSTENKHSEKMITGNFPFIKKLIAEAKESKEQMSLNERNLQKELWKNKDKNNKEQSSSLNRKNIVSYKDSLEKVIQQSDVILMMLDARDPLVFRSPEIEKRVISSGKRLVFILNKIDLIPSNYTKGWLSYLRKIAPTVAFKCNLQEQNSKLGVLSKRCSHKPNILDKSSLCFGHRELINLLSNYCRGDLSVHQEEAADQPTSSHQTKSVAIKVGVVGLPNTGKSSLVNSLKREHVCSTSNVAGSTRSVQSVRLDKFIHLVDSPGVILSTQRRFDPVTHTLLNLVKQEEVCDVVAAVEAIWQRCGTEFLIRHYNLPDFHDSLDQLMVCLARRFSCVEKKGVLNTSRAGRMLIRDWISGKIRFAVPPPTDDSLETEVCDPREQEQKYISIPSFLTSQKSSNMSTIKLNNVPDSMELDDCSDDDDDEEEEEEEESDDEVDEVNDDKGVDEDQMSE